MDAELEHKIGNLVELFVQNTAKADPRALRPPRPPEPAKKVRAVRVTRRLLEPWTPERCERLTAIVRQNPDAGPIALWRTYKRLWPKDAEILDHWGMDGYALGIALRALPQIGYVVGKRGPRPTATDAVLTVD
jgi:hypothetical protein